MLLSDETIAAIVTPAGRGGVGIVRVSGRLSRTIALSVLGKVPVARQCEYLPFKNTHAEVIDIGIALFFSAPHSFTGEDIIEFQGHGGPIVMHRLLKAVLDLGARLAKPGEFSERAFLNNKIDLTQAEAIADLIDSCSEEAAQSAIRSLQGDFSKQIHQLVNLIIHLRMLVEASIDFSEEEIDFLTHEKIKQALKDILLKIDSVFQTAKQGALLREGMHIVIAGKPNAGKSSLLNCLSGRETAIVTDIPGTTRDVLREHILLDGIPLHIIDTAGLRESSDEIEREGIKRARQEIDKADRVLFVIDGSIASSNRHEFDFQQFESSAIKKNSITIIRNKIDKLGEKPRQERMGETCILHISAKLGQGIDLLRNHLKECIGVKTAVEGGFIARQRHLEALKQAKSFLLQGQNQLTIFFAPELLAEDLRLAQQSLSEITGEFTSDDLLGHIFSQFCIGK